MASRTKGKTLRHRERTEFLAVVLGERKERHVRLEEVDGLLQSVLELYLKLHRICLDPHLGRGLLREHGDRYEGVSLEADDRLRNRIEIWREPVP